MRKRDRRRGRRRTQERRKQLPPADCTDRYADALEEIREEFIWDQGLDAGLCGLQCEGAGFLGSLCREQGGFDELIMIGFEAVDVVDPPNALLVNSYSEQGFTIETTNLNQNSALSCTLGLDTTFFSNAGIQRVSQSPGVRVAARFCLTPLVRKTVLGSLVEPPTQGAIIPHSTEAHPTRRSSELRPAHPPERAAGCMLTSACR